MAFWCGGTIFSVTLTTLMPISEELHILIFIGNFRILNTDVHSVRPKQVVFNIKISYLNKQFSLLRLNCLFKYEIIYLITQAESIHVVVPPTFAWRTYTRIHDVTSSVFNENVSADFLFTSLWTSVTGLSVLKYIELCVGSIEVYIYTYIGSA
jgi:hypothetical protein